MSRICGAVNDAESAAYGHLVRCHRFAGHDGSHENVSHDLAWGPEEPVERPVVAGEDEQ